MYKPQFNWDSEAILLSWWSLQLNSAGIESAYIGKITVVQVRPGFRNKCNPLLIQGQSLAHGGYYAITGKILWL